MPNNGKTQHEKLDTLLVSVQKIEITVARFDERINQAKEERGEMKDGIEENAKMKRMSNLLDGIGAIAIGIGTYFGMKY